MISPLISEMPAPAPPRRNERLEAAYLQEKFELALERLLEEIATEVVGRELLLAPVEVATIVRRLAQRYNFETEFDVDASLGLRVRAALDRALR